jgi:hypothetical protein
MKELIVVLTTMDILFSSIGIMAIIVFVVSTMMVYSFLDKRGEKVSFLWLRLFIFSYVNKYVRITKAETGKIGHIFYIWVISINIALLCAILVLFVF